MKLVNKQSRDVSATDLPIGQFGIVKDMGEDWDEDDSKDLSGEFIYGYGPNQYLVIGETGKLKTASEVIQECIIEILPPGTQVTL